MIQSEERDQAVEVLLEHADVLALALESLDGLLRRSETILDSVVESAAELRTTALAAPGLEGMDLKATLTAVAKLVDVLPRLAPAIDELTSPAMVNTLTVVSHSLNAGYNDFATAPVRVKGPLSVLKLLRDPDVARGLSFFATIGRAIGRDLEERA